MNRFVRDCLISGAVGGVLSHLVASVCSRKEQGRSELPMHAVSHIVWGDEPEDHRGHHPHNALVGSVLHHGACVFWAVFFEALFGRRAEASTPAAIAGGAAVSVAAYVTDYHVVSKRFRPGFEAYLSNRSMLAVYAALAVGLGVGARLRGFCDHQVENKNKGHEGWNAQRRPNTVVAPEQRI